MDDDAINGLIKIASKEVSYVQLVKPFSVFETRQISFFSFFSVLIGMVFSVTRIIPMGVIVVLIMQKTEICRRERGTLIFARNSLWHRCIHETILYSTGFFYLVLLFHFINFTLTRVLWKWCHYKVFIGIIICFPSYSSQVYFLADKSFSALDFIRHAMVSEYIAPTFRFFVYVPANAYFFKVKNRNTRKRCDIFS